jgi:succinate-semialdehyde dehydrogenase/glutarate-semialdehyde dehydrogenase
VADQLDRQRDSIARDLAREQGKTLNEAVDEVRVAAEMFRASAEDLMRVSGEVLPSVDPGKRIYAVREPLGVVGVITPWNFPLTIPSEYLSACLAAGNAVVWKPSSFTPISAVRLLECATAAGVPAGLINLVFGSGPVVAEGLTTHPAVTAIGATGSPAMGEAIAARAGTRKLLLELGGNGPAIVAEDADLDRAIDRIASGCFANAGQICDSTERILVHESVHDEIVEGLVEKARQVRLGPSLEASSTMGPLNNEETASKVDAHLEDARDRGARILFGGHRARGFPTSLYYEPTVIDRVTPEMRLNKEETFGPVAPVLAFRDDEHAIALANSGELGLVSGVFTRDLARAYYYAERLETGVVNVNEGPCYWQIHIPIGGYAGKRSGLGRLGSKYALEELTQLKAIVIDVGPEKGLQP